MLSTEIARLREAITRKYCQVRYGDVDTGGYFLSNTTVYSKSCQKYRVLRPQLVATSTPNVEAINEIKEKPKEEEEVREAEVS